MEDFLEVDSVVLAEAFPVVSEAGFLLILNRKAVRCPAGSRVALEEVSAEAS